MSLLSLFTMESQIIFLLVILFIQVVISVGLIQSKNDTIDSSQNLLQSIDDVQDDLSLRIITQGGEPGYQGINGNSGANGATGDNIIIVPITQTFIPTMTQTQMGVSMIFTKIGRLVTVQIQTTSFTPPESSIYSINGLFPTIFVPLVNVSFPVVAFDADFATICTFSTVGTFGYANANATPFDELNQTFTYISAS
jgi:hypothetical protein